jgi:hypothetical protein
MTAQTHTRNLTALVQTLLATFPLVQARWRLVMDRRRWISNSFKLLLGIAIGATGEASVERLSSTSLGEPIIQGAPPRDWWVERPINPNGDFSEGEKYWKGGYVGTGDARNATAGIKILAKDHGEAWLDNPDLSTHTNTALMQAVDNLYREAGLQCANWFLRDHHLMLEADVRIDNDQPYAQDSWSRIAIATWIQRKESADLNNNGDLYFTINGNSYTKLFTEFDVYRRNVAFLGYNAMSSGSNVNEYPADQLPVGCWKPYKIDLNEFITNGYNALGGWGKENHDMAMLCAWYLALEAKGAMLQASWRRIKIYNT